MALFGDARPLTAARRIGKGEAAPRRRWNMLNALVTPIRHFADNSEGSGTGVMDSFREHPSDFELRFVGRDPALARRRGGNRHRRAADARARLQLLGVAARRPRLPVDRGSRAGRRPGFRGEQRAARFHLRPRQSGDPLYRRRDPRRMRARRRHAHHRRRAEPVAAVAPDRPLYADHRQPRADRLRGRVRQSSAARPSAIAAS